MGKHLRLFSAHWLGPYHACILYIPSTKNMNTTLGSGSLSHSGNSGTMTWANEAVTITTSGNPDFSGLTSLTFRIYQYDDINANDAWGRTDYATADITVIPEPTAFGLLLALGSLGLVVFARRSRRSE